MTQTQLKKGANRIIHNYAVVLKIVTYLGFTATQPLA